VAARALYIALPSMSCLRDSIFPLGAAWARPVKIQMDGWESGKGRAVASPPKTPSGTHLLAPPTGVHFQHVPFALDTLPSAWKLNPTTSHPRRRK